MKEKNRKLKNTNPMKKEKYKKIARLIKNLILDEKRKFDNIFL